MPDFMVSPADTTPMREADLSPASVAFIERFLLQRPKRENPDRSPEIDDLIAYLLGEAPQDDARMLELRLVRDAGARRWLIDVDRAVESIRRLAWDDVIRLAAGKQAGADAMRVRVAQIWRQRLTRQMRLSPVGLKRCLRDSGGWNGIGRDEENRSQDQTLAWSMLSAMLRQSLRPTVAQAAYAVMRGSTLADPHGPAIEVVGLPSRYREAAVEIAEVTAEGALRVRIGLRLAAGHRWSRTNRRERIRLEFKAGSQAWLLDESIVREDSVEWSVPNIGAAMGLAPGSVDLSRMTLKFGRASRRLAVSRTEEPAAKPTVPETVTAAITESDGRPSQTQPALALSMPVSPAFKAGRLQLTLGIPPSARVSHASSQLNIDLAVTPERTQRLGSFAIGSWADDGAARLLEIPWPGGASSRADAKLVPMLLQISLQLGAGSRAANPER